MEKDEELKKEFELSVNNFGTATEYEDLFALAREIQTLILMKPGSFPNHPEMGVGIQDYQFEYLDNLTISEISTRINDQINTYINSNYVANAKVQIIPNKLQSKENTLGVLINLAYDINHSSEFILTFEQLEKKGKVASKIFI